MNSNSNRPTNAILQEALGDVEEDPSFVDGASFSHQDTSSSGDMHKPTLTSGRITVDAVHPFFTSYRNIHTYHCRQCNEDFETSLKSLKHHFMSKEHSPVSSCIYCHFPVYEYYENGNREIYHRCEEEVHGTRGECDTIDVSVNDEENISDSVSPSFSNLSRPILDGSSSNISQCCNTIGSSISDVSTDDTSV